MLSRQGVAARWMAASRVAAMSRLYGLHVPSATVRGSAERCTRAAVSSARAAQAFDCLARRQTFPSTILHSSLHCQALCLKYTAKELELVDQHPAMQRALLGSVAVACNVQRPDAAKARACAHMLKHAQSLQHPQTLHDMQWRDSERVNATQGKGICTERGRSAVRCPVWSASGRAAAAAGVGAASAQRLPPCMHECKQGMKEGKERQRLGWQEHTQFACPCMTRRNEVARRLQRSCRALCGLWHSFMQCKEFFNSVHGPTERS